MNTSDNVIPFRSAKGAGPAFSGKKLAKGAQSQPTAFEVSGGDPFLKCLVTELFRASPWITADAKSAKIHVDWSAFASHMAKQRSSEGFETAEWHGIGGKLLPTLHLSWFGNETRLYRDPSKDEGQQHNGRYCDFDPSESLHSALWQSFADIGAKALALINEWPPELVSRYSYSQDKLPSRQAAFLLQQIGEAKVRCQVRISPPSELPYIFRTDVAIGPSSSFMRRSSSPAQVIQALRRHVRSRHQMWRSLVDVYRQPSSLWSDNISGAMSDAELAALQRSTADVLATRLPRDTASGQSGGEALSAVTWVKLSEGLRASMSCQLVSVFDGGKVSKTQLRGRPQFGDDGLDDSVMSLHTLLALVSDAVGELSHDSGYSRVSLQSKLGKDMAHSLMIRKSELLSGIRSAQVLLQREVGKLGLPGGQLDCFARQVAALVIETPMLCMLSSGILRTYSTTNGAFKGFCLGLGVLAGEIGLRTMGALPLDYFGSSEDDADFTDDRRTEIPDESGHESMPDDAR